MPATPNPSIFCPNNTSPNSAAAGGDGFQRGGVQPLRRQRAHQPQPEVGGQRTGRCQDIGNARQLTCGGGKHKACHCTEEEHVKQICHQAVLFQLGGQQNILQRVAQRGTKAVGHTARIQRYAACHAAD